MAHYNNVVSVPPILKLNASRPQAWLYQYLVYSHDRQGHQEYNNQQNWVRVTDSFQAWDFFTKTDPGK